MDDTILKEQLSGAFDVTRLFEVFHTMAGVIKEQQSKIDEANGKITSLKREIKALPAPGSGGDERDAESLAALQAMQQQLADMHNHVHGTGSAEVSSGLKILKSKDLELIATAPSTAQYIAKLGRSTAGSRPSSSSSPFSSSSSRPNSSSRPGSSKGGGGYGGGSYIYDSSRMNDGIAGGDNVPDLDIYVSPQASRPSSSRQSARSRPLSSSRNPNTLKNTLDKLQMTNPGVQAVLADPNVRRVLRLFQDDPRAAQAALAANGVEDVKVKQKIDELIAAGAVSREQMAAVSDPVIQEIAANPVMQQLLRDAEANTSAAEQTLSSSPELKAQFIVLMKSGLVPKKKIAAITDYEVRSTLADQPTSLLGDVEQIAEEHMKSSPEVLAMLVDTEIRLVLQLFQSDPEAAAYAMSDPFIEEKIERLVAAGVVSKEQFAAVKDPEIQKIAADPRIKQLQKDAETNTLEAEQTLSSDPELKARFFTLMKSGLVPKKKVAALNDPEIRLIVSNQPASVLGDVEQVIQDAAKANPEVQEILRDADVRRVLKLFQDDPKAAQAALLEDVKVKEKVDKLIAAGAVSKEQLAAVSDPVIQEIAADPVMQQLLRDAETNTSAAEQALSSSPELKAQFIVLMKSGLVPKKKSAALTSDPEIRSLLAESPASILGDVEDVIRDAASGNSEVQELFVNPDIRQLLQDFQSDPKAAAYAMSDPLIRNQVEKLVAAGAVSKEQFNAIGDPVIQEIAADPVMKRLLRDAENNPVATEEKLSSDPELKSRFMTLIKSGLVPKKKVAALKDPEIRCLLVDQPASLLGDVEELVERTVRSEFEARIEELVQQNMTGHEKIENLSRALLETRHNLQINTAKLSTAEQSLEKLEALKSEMTSQHRGTTETLNGAKARIVDLESILLATKKELKLIRERNANLEEYMDEKARAESRVGTTTFDRSLSTNKAASGGSGSGSGSGGEDSKVEEAAKKGQNPLLKNPTMAALALSTGKIRHRGKMRVERLYFLSPEKRFLLLEKLQKKGRMIMIGRKMMEEARSKYSNQTLKNKVDFLEEELAAVRQGIEKVQRINKKNVTSIRDILPKNFDASYKQILGLLETMGTVGGPDGFVDSLSKAKVAVELATKEPEVEVQGPLTLDPAVLDAAHARITAMKEQIESMTSAVHDMQQQQKRHNDLIEPFPDAARIMCYTAAGEVPSVIVDSIAKTLNSTLLSDADQKAEQEIAKLKEHLLDLEADLFTSDDLQNMLSGGDRAGKSDGEEHITDPNHMRLINLVNKSVDSYYQKVELAKRNFNSLQLGPSSKDLEAIATAACKYTDMKTKRVLDLVRKEIEGIQGVNDDRVEKFDSDIWVINDQMTSLLSNQMKLMALATDMEARNHESEILRDLQKKMKNFAVNKLMQKIDNLQETIDSKPAARKVAEMMVHVEESFKQNIEATTAGVASYVDQLYEQMQHKIGREDLRVLINSKIEELETNLARSSSSSGGGVSTSVKCLGCGHPPMPMTAGGGGPSSASSRAHTAAANDSRVGSSQSMQYRGSPPRSTSSAHPNYVMQQQLQQPQQQGYGNGSGQGDVRIYAPGEFQGMMGDGSGLGEGSMSSLDEGSLDSAFNLRDYDFYDNHGGGGSGGGFASRPYSYDGQKLQMYGNDGSVGSQISEQELTALLTGTAGLKPIGLQHRAFVPKGAKKTPKKMPDALGVGRSFADPALRKKKMEAQLRAMTPIGDGSGGRGSRDGSGGGGGGGGGQHVSPVAGHYSGQYPNYVFDSATGVPAMERLPPLNL